MRVVMVYDTWNEELKAWEEVKTSRYGTMIHIILSRWNVGDEAPTSICKHTRQEAGRIIR